MTFILNLWVQLKALDSRAPYLAIALLVGAVIQIWKVFHRPSFDAQSPRIKALPAALIGAILMAAANANYNTVLIDVLFGALSGVTAVGGHETLRRLLAGEGQEQTPTPPNPPADGEPKEKASS